MIEEPKKLIDNLNEIRKEINDLAFVFAKESLNPINRIANKRARVALSKLIHKAKEYRKVVAPMARLDSAEMIKFKKQLEQQKTTS